MFEFPKMKRVFADAILQANFEKDGYVVVDFYTEEEIADATKLYHTLHPQDKEGFYPGTYSLDKNYRTALDLGVRAICQRAINKYLVDIKVVCGSFIVKTPGPHSGMSIHQDMTLVDESQYSGINIWVPLVDLSVKNGAIFILPGSHRIMPTYRGSSIPEFFSPVMDNMLDYLHPMELKAGQGVIFDQSIIHFSPPNYSDNIRIVTNTYVTHKDAEFRTYYWDKDSGQNAVEEYAQSDTFMTDYEQFGENIRDRPKVGKLLGLAPYDFPKIDINFLNNRFAKTNARQLVEAAKPIMPQQETTLPEKPKSTFLGKLRELVGI